MNYFIRIGYDFMATNPVGKDTKTIGLNMKADMAENLEKRKRMLRAGIRA
jgi:hypothetical protein